MAFKLAEAFVEIGARDGGLNGYLGRVKGDLGGLSGSSVDLSGAALLGGAAAAGIAGAAAIAAGMVAATKAASDLNEQVSKASVVFGPAAQGVITEAQAMADAFGVPKSEFIDAASSIGLIGKASGLAQPAAAKLGTDFAKLGIDASSFYNVPLNDALMAIRSGLVGEAEPMRRFGVLLNEAAVKSEAARLGIAKMGTELTEGQKVQARASLIMKGMTDAQGDMARTADSTANRMRSLGGQVTNVMADIGTVIQPAANVMLRLGDETLKGVAGWTSWAAASGKAAEGTAGLGAAAPGVSAATKALDTAATKATALEAATKRAAASAKLLKSYKEAFNTAGLNDRDKAMFEVRKKGGTAQDVRMAGALVDATARREASAEAFDLGVKLRDEARTLGMSAEAAQLYMLKLRGASPAVLAMAEANVKNKEALAAMDEMGAEAEKVFEATRTPVEKLVAELERLQDLRTANLIDESTFDRASKEAARQAAEGNEQLRERAKQGVSKAFTSQVLDASSFQRSIQTAALSTKDDTARKHLKVSQETKQLLDENLKKIRAGGPATFTR